MNIAQNIHRLKEKLPEEVTLVAVSKTKSEAEILEAYNAGQRVFGENKIQEMTTKWETLPKDIQWHMIGHVQRNKVKYMAQFVSLIHGVDSLKLLTEINKQAKKHNRVVNCLLQIKIAKEESKFGLDPAEATRILENLEIETLANVKVVGFMGMATYTDALEQLKEEFSVLQQLYNSLKKQYDLSILSMGMSGDYQTAIDCQSNMVRIGSAIFGQRNY